MGRFLLPLGAAVVAALCLLALLAPWLAPYDPVRPVAASFGNPFPPQAAHWFGTDELGRDVMSRIIFGSRVSLLVALLATAASMLLGVTIGVVAGYAGGWADSALMRFTDVMLAFPGLLLAVGLAALWEPGLRTMLTVIVVVSWTGVARTVRADVLAVREREFVRAAEALGASPLRVVVRHLLPNVLPTIVVMAALSTCGTLMLDAGLSYLGLGLSVPTPSWGRMLADSRTFFRVAPWLMIFPGCAILVAVVGFNFLGYGLLAVLQGSPDAPHMRRPTRVSARAGRGKGA